MSGRRYNLEYEIKKKRNTKHKPRWGQRERDEEEGKS